MCKILKQKLNLNLGTKNLFIFFLKKKKKTPTFMDYAMNFSPFN